MSLSKRLAILLALALALALSIVVAVGWLSLRARDGLIDGAHQLAQSYEVIEALDALLADMTDAETGQRGFVVTGDESYLEPFKRAVDRISGDLGRLDALLRQRDGRTALDQLDQLVEEKISLSREIIGLRRTQGFGAAAKLVATNRGRDTMDAIRRIVSDLRARQRELLSASRTLAASNAAFANVVLVGGTVASSLLIVAIFVLLAREVRVRRATEKKLRHDQAISDGILTSMSDGVTVVDRDGNLVRMNPAAERLLGRTAGSFLGNQPRDVLTVYEADGATPFAPDETPLSRALRGESVEDVECTPRLPGRGEAVWLCASARPLVLSDGTTIGAVCVFRDVTAAKRAERRLEESNATLKSSVSELERRNDEIELLGELSGLLQACASEDEASAVIAQSLERLLPMSRGRLYLLNPSGNLAFGAATWGDPPPTEDTFAPDACWALRRGHVHTVDSRRLGLRCAHVGESVANYLCIPMMAQGEGLGVLHARFGAEGGEGWGAVQRVLHAVADEIGLALANLRLRESLRRQSIRDPLTNLFNRRYMEESLDREMQRALRRDAPLSVLMIDIDHFKQFNDSFGHDAGDALLCEIGGALQSGIRGEDLACRYGGEEFLVILPDSALDDATARAEELRTRVRGIVVSHHERSLRPVTLSVGVAAFPGHGTDMKSLVHAADQALYRAKRDGRDRVAVARAHGTPSSGTAA